MTRTIFLLAVMVAGLTARAQTDFQYYNLALVKYNMSDYQGAITDLTKAVSHNPDNFSALVLRGSAKYNLEDYGGAIEDYTRAIGIISGEKKEPVKLTIYDQQGNIISSHDTREPDPNLAVPYYNRALARVAAGYYREAVDDFSIALENGSDEIGTYFNRGIAWDRMGKHEEAIEDYTRVLDLEPSLAQVYFRRGHSSFELGRNQDACCDWEKAYELGHGEAAATLSELCNKEDHPHN